MDEVMCFHYRGLRRPGAAARHRLSNPRKPLQLAIILVACGWAAVEGSQGMGRTTRAPRPVRPVETHLPPIRVAFEDIAEQAGLTGRQVSGHEDRKDYILEATGNGVAIFDFDGDGLA